MKILLLSYACEPGKGSEASTGWHWVTGLAQEHSVYVLTHPRGRESIERYLAAQPNPKLEFDFVKLPALLDPWQRDPGEKLIHFRYILWQFAMYAKARKLVKHTPFDLVHHVSWVTMTGPTFGWALGLPFIWGPVGSGQQAPLQMRRHLGAKGWVREALRNVQVRLIGLNPLANVAARKSRAAIATNLETYDALRKLRARSIHLIRDSAVDDHWVPESYPERPAREKPVITWLGRVESRKAPGLAIEAFAKARAEHPCELWIIGQGSLLEPSKKLAEQLGVSNDVRFWGRVPHDEVPKMLLDSDIFLFTSLRDTFPTVVLESMALGLPAVSLDHQGLRTLTDDAVIKVPVTDSETIVNDLAHALSQLVQAPAERRSRGYAAWENVQKEHLWRHRYESMRNVYDTALIQSPSPEEQFAYDRPS